MPAHHRDVCSFSEQAIVLAVLSDDLLGCVTSVLHLDHPPSAQHGGQRTHLERAPIGQGAA